MTITKTRKRASRRTLARYRPRLDHLEVRLALSGVDDFGFGPDADTVQVSAWDDSGGSSDDSSTDFGSSSVDGFGSDLGASLAVISVSPASGSVMSQGPSSLSVTFDRPIDPFSIGFDDFKLVRLADHPGDSDSLVDTQVVNPDDSDPTGRTLIVTLDASLPAGNYRLSVSGSSFLTGTDGSMLDGSDDREISTFQVVAAGLDFSNFVDLGTPTSSETVRSGQLDLLQNPSNSDLYRFTLPAGKSWSLSLEITAQRDGGTLDANVTLYDADGQLIATADQGHIDAPLDPYLNASLAGGTYFIQVAGRLRSGSQDGSYHVHLTATAAASSTEVLAIATNWANPFSETPTGFTIQFSGPIALNQLENDANRSLVLVDSQGQTWPVIPTGVSPDGTRVAFVFGTSLPAGSYTLRLGDTSTLVNSAGISPTAPGRPAGDLGLIEIEAGLISAQSELGTIWPSVGASVGGSVDVEPGTTVSRTFTVLGSGNQTFDSDSDLSQFQITILDAEGRPVAGVDGSENGGIGRNLILEPGNYSIVLSNRGTTSASISFTITMKSRSAASLLDSGIGQATTSRVRIAPWNNPTPGNSGPSTGNLLETPAGNSTPTPVNGGQGVSTVPTPQVPDATPVTIPITPVVPTPTPPSHSSTAATNLGPFSSVVAGLTFNEPSHETASASGPARAISINGPGETSGSAVLASGLPIGLPSPTFNQINVVGPVGSSGQFALASAQPGLPTSLRSVPESIASPRSGLFGPIEPGWDGLGDSPGSRPAKGAKPSPAGSIADGRVVQAGLTPDLSWLDRAIEWVGNHATPNPSAIEETGSPTTMARAEGSEESETIDRIDYASLGSPAILVATIVATYRMRAGWKRQGAARESKKRQSLATNFRPKLGC